MRIIAGKLKGLSIPFINKKFGAADVTAERMKEAVFSIIGDGIEGSCFLDLYSCSGQIGMEALSRGSVTVVFNEKDRKRREFITAMTGKAEGMATIKVYNLDAFRCMSFLSSSGMVFDYIYADPPYKKIRGEVTLYRRVLEYIKEKKLLNPEGFVIIQHYVHNILPEKYGGFRLSGLRHYGTSGAAFYIPCAGGSVI